MADGGRDLEHGLHQLRADALDELALLDGGENGVDVLDEVERRRVEEHVLLLDAEREGVSGAELVVEDASARGEALPRDRSRIDLLHSPFTTASTSISTSQRGSTNPRTTIMAFAGRIDEKTSPCARAMPSKCSASVRKTRVRTTCSGRAAGSSRAG